MEAQWWLPPVVAFVISFFTSMVGISGAFLLLPIQISFLGLTGPAVSATNLERFPGWCIPTFPKVVIPTGAKRSGGILCFYSKSKTQDSSTHDAIRRSLGMTLISRDIPIGELG